MPLKPQLHVAYQGSAGGVDWLGKSFVSIREFLAYLMGPVKARYLDAEPHDPDRAQAAPARRSKWKDFPALRELRMEIATPWMLAQSLAECMLADDPELGAVWTTNMARLKVNARAYLAGADAVGFCWLDGELRVAICEFKSSSDADSPPAVMRGPEGLACQLQKFSIDKKTRQGVLYWLAHTCHTPEHEELRMAAESRYNPQKSMNILLVGVLLRDTEPRSTDVAQAAKVLAQSLGQRMRGTLQAIHVPIPLAALPVLIRSEGPWKLLKIS